MKRCLAWLKKWERANVKTPPTKGKMTTLIRIIYSYVAVNIKVKLLGYIVISEREDYIRSVGKGAFGKVRVVQHKGTKKLYALKYINKEKCIGMKAVENIISERHLLERIGHNLIVNLRYAFQDDEHLFMVLDLMLGGDLRFHLERLGKLPENYVQFYAAELSLALNYLHSENIVHR
ncbi:hypothetical protein G6F56_011405 [Rhizopus delemar]|nr:hypothetical protein G6F56_011405 [Rhizopus delemar]